MSNTTDGWDSPVCTQKWCRTVVDPGAGHQVLIDGEEHRLCWKHWAEYAADEPKEGGGE